MGAIKSKQVNLINLIEKTYLANSEERYDTWVCADALCVAALLNPNVRSKLDYIIMPIVGIKLNS